MKIKSVIILFFLVICCTLVGCKGTQPTQLPTPSNFKVVEKVLTWDVVENAEGYIVFADDVEYEATVPSFDLSFLGAGEYVIEVMALGDYELFTDSDWAKFTYIAEEEYGENGNENGRENESEKENENENEIGYTEGLTYTLLEDGTGYEVHRGNANLNGVIVFPDTYNGLPVKKISNMAFQLNEKPDISHRIGINTETTGIRLPKYLEEIGDNAFGYCEVLSDVIIPNGVKKIGKEAFYYTNIKSLQIPEGVEVIGEYAFANSVLVDVYLPDTLRHIPEGLFFYSPLLERIRFPERIESFGAVVVQVTKWYDSFPNDYVMVNGFLLGYKGTATVVTIPETVTHIVDRAFSNTRANTPFFYENCCFEKMVIPGSVVLGEGLFYKNEYLKELVLEEGIKAIPNKLCYECRELEKITIPQSIQDIGASAFFKTAFTELVLPSNMTVIGEHAFSSADIVEITWPDNLIEIGAGAFSSCNFKELDIPQSVVTIGDQAFYGCEMESVTIPSGVEYIGSKAFGACKKLTSLYIPDSVTYMGEEVFKLCKLLENVVLPKGLETIPMGTFYECKGLKTISLPTGIKEIGEWAFYCCTSLETIQLPDGLEVIGDYAFDRCENLKALSLPDSVKTIGNKCFDNCSFERMDLSNVENMGACFMSCEALKEVILPKGITTIPKSCFKGCSSLAEIVLPKSVTTISQYAFSSCSALQTIYFEGTEEEFSQIVVEEKNNDAFFNANVVFYSETEPPLTDDGTAYDGEYWYYASDGKTPIAWRKENENT